MQKEVEMRILIQATLSLLCTFVWFGSAVFAEPSVIVSEGKYVMGDLDSRKDAKALALIEAKRLALEQAGTYIQSSSEVKDFQLSRDQVNTLASGIMSVEVLKEDWKLSGENMVVTMQIRATIDTSHIKDRITRINESENTESFKEIQNQMAALQKELAELKTQRQNETVKGAKAPPSENLKEKHTNLINKISALEYMETGNTAILNKQWEDSVAAFDLAISINPRLMDAYAGKSFALYNLNKPKDALAVVNNALGINPQSARNLGLKALILKDQPEKLDMAIECINKAIQLKPKNPRLYGIRGEVYVKKHRPRLAYKDFTTACTLGGKEACNRASVLKEKTEAGKNRL
jgi:tetratricopeptide (TPR) repeat protein